MDLTKFSTNDLRALQSGDLSKVSTPGLKILMGQTAIANPQRELNADATAGMSGMEQFRAGVGKAFSDLGSGIKQAIDIPAAALERAFGGERASRALGLPTAVESAKATQADIDETKKRDAPLMKTGAGFAGNIVGNVATMLPAVAIPGAATIAGAGLVGAGMGAVQPVASDESRLTNTVLGGAAGAGGVGLGRLVGKTAQAVRGPAQTPELAAGIQAARDAGYVIPPTQANPTLGNRLLEGLAGKITTAQNASARNQGVTNSLAAKALNLAPDTPLTPDVLKTVRQQASQAYEGVRSLGAVTADGQFAQDLNT